MNSQIPGLQDPFHLEVLLGCQLPKLPTLLLPLRQTPTTHITQGPCPPCSGQLLQEKKLRVLGTELRFEILSAGKKSKAKGSDDEVRVQGPEVGGQACPGPQAAKLRCLAEF